MSAKSQGGKSSKTHTPPVKKMNEQQLIIKRPKLLNFSDRKEDQKSPEEMILEPFSDSKVIRSIRNM